MNKVYLDKDGKCDFISSRKGHSLSERPKE